MTANDVKDIKRKATGAICGGDLAYAFVLIRQLSDEAAEWKIASRLDECAMLYRQMLIYKYRKAEDPDRDKFIQKLKADLLSLLEDVCEMLNIRYSASYEYVQTRVFALKNADIAAICTSLRTHSPAPDSALFSPEFERTLEELFEYIWLSGTWSDRDAQEIGQLLTDGNIPQLVRSMAVSALTLNLLHRYDPQKMAALFRGQYSGDGSSSGVLYP